LWQRYLEFATVEDQLRKTSFGPFKGRNKLEMKRNPVVKLAFIVYLTPPAL